MMQSTSPRLDLDRVQQRAMRAGAVALVVCLLWGLILNAAQFLHAYLMAYLFWLGIALGCLAILMLHHLVGGTWGSMIQRILEASTRTLPVMALLFLPVLFGVRGLYDWARPEIVANDLILQHKSGYLNVPFFVIRAVLYFAIWLTMIFFLNRWSHQHEVLQGQPQQLVYRQQLQRLSAGGLLVYVLTMTFASIDWAMSLAPHWYSTLYGLVFVISQVLSGLAFSIVVISRLAALPAVEQVVTPQRFHDLGNLLLAFVMLWAYIGFSQFLIIWSGNTAEEVPWYLHRMQGGWEWIGMLLLVFHFALPFVLLLLRVTKRNVRALAGVAAALLLMHMVDQFWLILPELHPSKLSVHVLDVLALIGIGGLWLAVFLSNVKARSLIPVEDRRLQEAHDHE